MQGRSGQNENNPERNISQIDSYDPRFERLDIIEYIRNRIVEPVSQINRGNFDKAVFCHEDERYGVEGNGGWSASYRLGFFSSTEENILVIRRQTEDVLGRRNDLIVWSKDIWNVLGERVRKFALVSLYPNGEAEFFSDQCLVPKEQRKEIMEGRQGVYIHIETDESNGDLVEPPLIYVPQGSLDLVTLKPLDDHENIIISHRSNRELGRIARMLAQQFGISRYKR